jgi:hypothetical protein
LVVKIRKKEVKEMKCLVNEFWFKMFVLFLVMALLISGGCAVKRPTPTTPSEPKIPANYTTYTDESKLFSISYPQDWETALSAIPDIEQTSKSVLKSLKADLPVEKTSCIFLAGLRTTRGYMPNLNIVVEPLPPGISTHDQVVEAEIRGLQKVVQDYQEFSRVKTTVGGRMATIIDYEGTFPERGKWHFLQMITLVDKTVWVVSCTSSLEDFAKWEKDFYAIVKSLQISQ